MGPHLFIHEHLLAEHRQELQHEMEQQRMARASAGTRSGMRHMAASFGSLLVAIGQSLERLESREQFQQISSLPDVQTTVSGSLHL